MYPDDRVLVGIINRRTDLHYLLQDLWYRVPQERMPHGVYVEYLAFFLGGAAKGKKPSGIYYYAKRSGLELAYRYDLLPDEADHKRANDVYYQVQFDEIKPKDPPILNQTNRRFAFIHTTWDRFIKARIIPDLYSEADYFVDRIYHALRDNRIRSERFWDVQKRDDNETQGAGLRILCEQGVFSAYVTAASDRDGFYLDPNQSVDATLKQILDRIRKMGGPATLPIPHSR